VLAPRTQVIRHGDHIEHMPSQITGASKPKRAKGVGLAQDAGGHRIHLAPSLAL